MRDKMTGLMESPLLIAHKKVVARATHFETIIHRAVRNEDTLLIDALPVYYAMPVLSC